MADKLELRPQSDPKKAVVPQRLKVPAPPGQFGEVRDLQAFLESVREKVHLLSPVVSLESIPEFHSATVRYVLVDPRIDSGDVYEPERGDHSKVALTKVALDRIAGTAGINWDPVHTRRLDDGSDPHYCFFQAFGWYRDIDGTPRSVDGRRELDLRDGAPRIRGWSEGRLNRAREFIQPMCETMAKNRVVRQLGVKGGYNPRELWEKPFAIITLTWTGRSDDPDLQKEAKRALMLRGLEARTQLFGHAPVSAMPELEHVAPPPVEAPREPVTSANDDATDAELVSDTCCPDAPAGVHLDDCPNRKGEK